MEGTELLVMGSPWKHGSHALGHGLYGQTVITPNHLDGNIQQTWIVGFSSKLTEMSDKPRFRSLINKPYRAA